MTKRTIKDIRDRVAFGIKNARKMLKDPNYIPYNYQPEKTKCARSIAAKTDTSPLKLKSWQ